MSELRYVVRFFKDSRYSYSVHCDQHVLDDLLEYGRNEGFTFKVIAYDAKEYDESEV